MGEERLSLNVLFLVVKFDELNVVMGTEIRRVSMLILVGGGSEREGVKPLIIDRGYGDEHPTNLLR